MFMAILEEERRSRGMTQKALAGRVGLSERAYRAAVSGESQMHPEVQNNIAKSLRSPRLAAAVLAEFEDNPFAPALLDVDDHPALELHAALAELQEALAAIGDIDVCKPSRQAVERAIDQMLDLIHLIPAVACSWSKAYQVDLWAARQRNINKLRTRGYIQEREEAA